MRQRLASIVLLTGMQLFACQVHADADWPQVALPDGVQRFEMGGQMNVDGVPLRMEGFLSRQRPAELAAWFRSHLGKPLMENQVAGKTVLGRAQGDFYLSVQLETLEQGTRGLVSVSNRKAAFLQHAATKADAARLLARFPADSRLVSHLTSQEDNRLVTYYVVSNRHHEQLNRDHLVGMLAGDGLGLEREGKPDRNEGMSLPAGAANGHALFFKGSGKNAVAVIFRGADGAVQVVLQSTVRMERYK